MKVKDLMEPIKSWLTPEMTLKEAIKVMKGTKRRHGMPVNGIVVLDNEMRLVGIVSTIDILRLIIPSHAYMDEHHYNISWESIRLEKTRLASTIKVSRFMTEDVRVIAAEAPLLHCADMLLTEHVRRLPVTRSDGRVVGVIYLRDVYNALSEMVVE